MQIIVSGRQMKLTDGIKGYVDGKLSRLEKYLDPESEVKVTVSAKKDRQKVEVTIIPINGQIIRAEDVEDDLYAAIDIVCDKLSRQVVKYKTKVKDKVQNNKSIRFENLDFIDNSSEFDDYDVKPMSSEEAILQMELVGHNFYMFRNQDNFEINIVYKRKAGGYGLIEQD